PVRLEWRRESIRRETALLVQPPGQREVMESDHRRHAVLVTCVQDAAVVRQLGPRELAFSRFDASPFDAETKRVEPEVGQHRDVLAESVIEVARITRRLAAWRGGDVLPPPPIRVGVAALGLVGGDRSADQEGVGEAQRVVHPGHVSAVSSEASCSPHSASCCPARGSSRSPSLSSCWAWWWAVSARCWST